MRIEVSDYDRDPRIDPGVSGASFFALRKTQVIAMTCVRSLKRWYNRVLEDNSLMVLFFSEKRKSSPPDRRLRDLPALGITAD